jgi:hypothetical protein
VAGFICLLSLISIAIIVHENSIQQGVVVHACNSSSWEAEIEGSKIQGQPGLQIKQKKTN